jgi:cupin fold WbuC family metalloprotein
VIFYNDKKIVTDFCTLDPKYGMYGVNIPAGQWHNIEILATDTVIFECKDGPYAPLNSEDIL